MSWLFLLAYFFGGFFLANAVPHVVSGMMGRPFQSPFAKPPEKACRHRASTSSGVSSISLSVTCWSVASAIFS